MKFETVIFDLDGTLLDTLADLTASTNAALSSCDLPPRRMDEVRQFVGNGIHKLMERAVPNGMENPRFDEAFAAFQAHYQQHCNDQTSAYPGILPLLARLKEAGIATAIVSNKADFAVKTLAKRYFSELVPVAIGERPEVAKKPAPDTVLQALRELGKTADRAVYVGDSDVDIETAKAVGMPCISVSYGFRSEEFLKAHGAATLCATVSELEAKLFGESQISAKTLA